MQSLIVMQLINYTIHKTILKSIEGYHFSGYGFMTTLKVGGKLSGIWKCPEMSKNVQIIIEHKEKTERVKNIENTCSVHAERKIGSELLCRWIDDFKKNHAQSNNHSPRPTRVVCIAVVGGDNNIFFVCFGFALL
jgi:hypothetical protein